MVVSETVLQQTLQMMHKNSIVWSHTIFTVSITYSGVITVTQRHLMSARTISMNEVTDIEYIFSKATSLLQNNKGHVNGILYRIT